MKQNQCCGKTMGLYKGRKVETDPLCKRGRAVRHQAGGCTCTYRPLRVCSVCRRQVVDEESTIAPYLLTGIFSI